jgi:hypothetical protein
MQGLRNWGRGLVLAALLVSLAGCNGFMSTSVTGSGTLKSETRAVSGFTEVAFSTVGTLTIEQTGTEALTVAGDDNIVPLIKTVVQNSRLEIRQDDPAQNLKPAQPLTYHLTVKDLNQLTVSGAGTVTSPGLKEGRFTLDSRGSSQIRLDGLAIDVLLVTISGSGTATLAGTTPTQTVHLSGAGNYEAGELDSTGANVTITGSGNGTVRVRTALTANISGSGNLTYRGSPTVQQQISGAGRLIQQIP